MSQITDAQVEAAANVLVDQLSLAGLERACREVAREALEAAERAAWRPIEEAPKERMKFLWLYCAEDQSRWLAAWQGQDDEACWYGVDEMGLRRTSETFQPTHFRPLPFPPEAAP